MVSTIDLKNSGYIKLSAYMRTELNNRFPTKKIPIFLNYFLQKSQEELKQIDRIEFTIFKNINLSKTFFEKNSKKIEEDRYFNRDITRTIISLILYYIEEDTKIINNNIRDGSYGYYGDIRNLEEYNKKVTSEDEKYDNIDQDEILPDSNYDEISLWKNLFLNSRATHLFNYTIQPTTYIYGVNKIKRVKLRIVFETEEVTVPTEYTSSCEHPDHDGLKVKLKWQKFEADVLYCSRDIPGANLSHKISTTSKNKTVSDSILMYGYVVEICLEDGSFKKVEQTFYSFKRINSGIIDAEIISVTESDTKIYFFILSINDKAEKEFLNYKILSISNNKNKYPEEVLFQSIRKYLKKEVNYILREENKVLFYIPAALILSKRYHNSIYSALIVGDTGTGKSFYPELLSKFIDVRFGSIYGNEATKNVYLGGNSIMRNSVGSSIIKGAVGNYDILVVSEVLDKLYEDERQMKGRGNIFSWHKEIGDGKVRPTSQGTKEYSVTASEIWNGNIKDLPNTEKYKKDLMRAYKPKELNIHLPLFRPIDYYKKELKDESLAKAHFEVRSKLIESRDYIFNISHAELARFLIVVGIEDTQIKCYPVFSSGSTIIPDNIHKDQFTAELDDIMGKNVDLKNKDYGYFKEITDYLTEYFSGRHNLMPNYVNLNSHLQISIINFMRERVYDFKKFNGDYQEIDLEHISDEEKKYMDFWLSIFYNILDRREANLERKPFINDFSGFSRDETIKDQIKKEDNDKKEAEDIFKFGYDVTDSEIFENVEDFNDDKK